MGLGYIGEHLPQEWISTFLTDLVNPKQWKTISAKDLLDEGYVVYGANGKIGFYKEFTHEAPTLMITCRGATCGNLHISEPCSYINGNAMALDNQPTSLVGLKFLNYVLQARKLDDVISGSAQPQITIQGLQDVRIPLPPLEEQKLIERKIGSALAQVDSIKTRLDQIPQILKRFRQAVLSAAVSGRLTEDVRKEKWATTTLIEVVKDRPRNGHSPKSVEFETKYKNLTLSAVTKGYFIDGLFKFVDLNLKEDSYLWVRNGDLLIQRANSLEYVGVSAIYEGEDNKYVYPDLIMKVTPNEKILGKFLHYSLLNIKVRKYFWENATGTAGNMPKINQKVVSEAPLLLPPIEEQTEIVARVEKLFAWADNIEKQVNAAQQRVNNLTQSILAKAFRGELTEQWRKDHPQLISGENSAATLLAKIKAERLALAPKRKTKAKRQEA